MHRKSQSMSCAMGHGDRIVRVVLARKSKSKPVVFQSVDGGLVHGGSHHPSSQGSNRGLLGGHHRIVHALNLIRNRAMNDGSCAVSVVAVASAARKNVHDDWFFGTQGSGASFVAVSTIFGPSDDGI